MTTDSRADHELVEQHPDSWFALPGLACGGGSWDPCPNDGAWMVRGYGRRAYCTRHAAQRLRIADQLAAEVTR
ncbi:hypothetical protein ABT324_00485 [Saccharopolyspora sp. NPDC000359]|uniref:hypothetical protein n=1 Tax=Saccharopolyspora sp. NPDC000359 TaxID=3154251 RepID=UPI0033210BFE